MYATLVSTWVCSPPAPPLLHVRYVKGLRLLHDDFRAWISENDKPVIPDDVLKQILGNIGSLVGLNSGLLSDLEARMANW